MKESLQRTEGEQHPVVFGLLALIGVGLAVGLVLGGMALAATRVLGVSEVTTVDSTSDGQTMYLPRPTKTSESNGPLITLAPDPNAQPGGEPSEPTPSESPLSPLALSASQTEVAQMEQIDLTGVFPGGEGAILQVQRFTNGSWTDFPVTASVSNETFSTYLLSSQLGVNRFRVVDTDTGLKSNEVRVTIS